VPRVDAMPFTFLMCSERSGSNFLTRLVDAHPELCGPPPVHLIRTLCDGGLGYADLCDGRVWRALIEDVAALLATQVGAWRTEWSRERLLVEVEERSLGALVRHVYQAEARAHGKRRLFVKENHVWRYLPFILSAFPGATVVYMVRDPRDMALSWKRCRELRGDVLRASRVWSRDQAAGLEVLGQLRLCGRIAFVRYEDLVDRTAEQARRLCEQLGVRYDPEMLLYYTRDDTRAVAAATASWENVARAPMRGNHGKFREHLSTDEVRWVEHVCGEEMEIFGYPLDHPSLEEPGAVRERLESVERHDKPGWAQVPESEKRVRAARLEVITRMRTRPSRAA